MISNLKKIFSTWPTAYRHYWLHRWQRKYSLKNLERISFVLEIINYVNPLNAELNPICHLLILLEDLTFMGPCIISIFQYVSNKMQRYTVYLYLETALHVSGSTFTHHQERIHLYLQHLVFVTPLLLSAAIVEELEQVWVCCGWRTRISYCVEIEINVLIWDKSRNVLNTVLCLEKKKFICCHNNITMPWCTQQSFLNIKPVVLKVVFCKIKKIQVLKHIR
jgi:hypothetical protein